MINTASWIGKTLSCLLFLTACAGQPLVAQVRLLPPIVAEEKAGASLLPASLGEPIAQELPPPSITFKLDELEKLALENNPTLAGAAALVLQQQGFARQAGLYPNPTLGYVRNDPDQAGQSRTQGVFVSQDIVTAGKLRLAQTAFTQEAQASEWQLEAQRARILNDVRLRYYETLGAQEAIAGALDLEKVAEEGVRLARQLLDAKHGTRPDLLQAEMQLSGVRAALREARGRHESAWRQLTAVIGVPDLPRHALEGNLEEGLPAFDWDELVERLLKESPLLRAQEAQIQAAATELRLAQVQVVPNINVQIVAQRDNVQKYSSVSTFVGVPIPFFNRNQGNIVSAEGHLVQQQKERDRLKLALVDQLAGSFRQYQSLRYQAEQLHKEILPRAKENLDLTMLAYKAGQFDFARVLTARQFYFQSSLTYLDALTEARKSAIEIAGLQLTGGLNPAEVGTALQSSPGASSSGVRSVLFQQLLEQRNGASQTRPGALQAGNP